MIMLIVVSLIFCNYGSANPVGIINTRSMPSEYSVIRISQDLPFVTDHPETTKDSDFKSKAQSLRKEFIDMLDQLVNLQISNFTDLMQGDQPQLQPQPLSHSDTVANFDKSTLSPERIHTFQESQQNWINRIAGIIQEVTGHNTSLPNLTDMNISQSSTTDVLFSSLPSSDVLSKIEFIKPTCKEKLQMNGAPMNNLHLYLNFEFEMPNVSVYNYTSLKVESLQLHLHKFAVSLSDFNNSYSNMDQNDSSNAQEIQSTEEALNELYQKMKVNASSRVLKTQALYNVAQEKMIRVNIYKIRKNNKTHGGTETLYLLASASLPVLDEQNTSWNISQTAIKGKHSKKKLDLVVEVEDQNSRKLPASLFFKLECGQKNKGKPTLPNSFDVEIENFTREWNQTVWLELKTVEVDTRVDSINQVTSAIRATNNDL